MILHGQILLIICFLFYLIWWYRGFRPNTSVNRIGGLNGLLLAITALTGIAGVAMSLMGGSMVNTPLFITPSAILFTTIVAYIVLLLITRFLMNRVVTSELFLIIAWTALEVWVVNCLEGAGLLPGARFGIMIGVLLLAFLGSMVCYVLYYKIEEKAAFYTAMVPLIAGIVSMVTLVGMAR